MKKGVLRSIALFFVVAMLTMAFNITSFAADSYTSGYWTYEFTDNGLKITGYTGNEANVVIPTVLNDYRVSSIGARAFKNNVTMKTVTIPETITSIGSEAFLGCVGLSQINYNAKNCTVPEIWRYDDDRGVGVFSGAGSAAISLNVKFGSEVSVVPKNLFNTDYENGYGYAHITSITFSDSVRTIEECAFENCISLEKISFGDNVTTVGNRAFYGCEAVSNITLNDNLSTIGESAFENCVNLEEIVWGEGLDTIGNYAFKGCTSLKKAIIPKPTTVIGIQAFANDISLTEVTIPTTMTSIGAEAFLGDIKLSKINFNAKNCTVPDIWRYDEDRGVGVFSGAGSGAMSLEVVFGSSVTKVPDKLFNTDRENGYGYAYVTDITFNSSVKEIGSTAFENCESIESITFGSGVISINDRAFYGCTGLDKITFKDKLTSIGESAFENCTELEDITWGDGLDSIGNYAFRGCSSLKQAVIPSPTTTIGKQAFANTISMTKLTIPTTVTSIGAEAFYNTTKLTTINYNAKNCSVPEIWRYDDDRGVGLFSGAGSGTSGLTITFGSKVTHIPANLFNTDYENGYDHAYITSVSIPSSVKEIGASAFEDCLRLNSVTCKRVNATLGENVYKNCPSSIKFTCYYGSTTETYAKNNSLSYSYLKPVKPALGKISNTSKGIKITWEGSSGASRYYIYRKTSSTGSWKVLDYVTASSGKKYYVDDEAKAGKTYYYTVKAYAPGNLYSKYDSTGLKIERLKAPGSVKLTNKSSGIYVDWNKSTGASKYYVYRSKNGGNYKKIATTSNTYYYDKTATGNGNKFSYIIYAYDNGTFSVASSAKKMYRLSTPKISSLSSKSAGKLTLKWNKNSGATGYKIQYATNSSFENAKTITVSGKSNISKTISGLSKGKRYYVRVRAYRTVSGTNYYSQWSSYSYKTTKK